MAPSPLVMAVVPEPPAANPVPVAAPDNEEEVNDKEVRVVLWPPEGEPGGDKELPLVTVAVDDVVVVIEVVVNDELVVVIVLVVVVVDGTEFRRKLSLVVFNMALPPPTTLLLL